MGDTESCGSRAVEFSVIQSRKRRTKAEVYAEILDRLRDLDVDEVTAPGFEDELWAHFCRLPARYALDVNVERAQDVLIHMRLLHLAGYPATRPAVEVRLVQAYSISDLFDKPFVLNSQTDVDGQSSYSCGKNSIHPPPAFGFVHEVDNNLSAYGLFSQQMHEITISTIDKPKLLSQLTSLLSEIGLNIQEAHAFSTTDGYSLDVFVVDGWKNEDVGQLKAILVKDISQIENHSLSKRPIFSTRRDQERSGTKSISYHVSIPSNGCDVGEIDVSLLKYGNKIASGSYGDLYRGTFCGQDVAIKVLNAEHLTENIRKDFSQEFYILRRVQHKNVVRLIGACSRPPSLCIVTEFLSGGSVYDFLHKKKGVFKFPSLLRVAIDVSKGMKYLHQNNIVHRDLKAANLLMDENGVVKVSDFGVARVQSKSGVMTAETGTYRWMAPEVIEHRPYNHKADVFSFAILLWELLTGKLPYEHLTPMQAAVGVAQKGLRPSIPSDTHPELRELIERCWQHDPSLRPDFSEIEETLQHLSELVADTDTDAGTK